MLAMDCERQGMVPAFSKSCCNLMQGWKKKLGPAGNYEVDIMPEFENLTGDIISRAAFGSSYEGGKVFEPQKEQAALVLAASLAIY